MEKYDEGLYWIYSYSDREWSVASYYDGHGWNLIGSDVTIKELDANWFIGSKLDVPMHEPSRISK